VKIAIALESPIGDPNHFQRVARRLIVCPLHISTDPSSKQTFRLQDYICRENWR